MPQLWSIHIVSLLYTKQLGHAFRPFTFFTDKTVIVTSKNSLLFLKTSPAIYLDRASISCHKWCPYIYIRPDQLSRMKGRSKPIPRKYRLKILFQSAIKILLYYCGKMKQNRWKNHYRVRNSPKERCIFILGFNLSKTNHFEKDSLQKCLII